MATNPHALFSQNAPESSNSVGSNSRHPLMETRVSHVPLVAHGQLRSMLRPSQSRQVLQQGQAMLEYQRIRRLNTLAATIVIKQEPSVDLYYSHPMVAARMIHTMMPHQQYAASGLGHMQGSVPTSSIVGASGHSGLLPTYMGMPEHGSENTAMGYHLQTLKRKAVTTELALGSPAPVSATAMPDWFDLANTHKEEPLMRKGKKKKTMPVLDDEGDDNDDDDLEEVRGIDFLQSTARRLTGNKRNSVVCKRSSTVLVLDDERDDDDVEEAREIDFFPWSTTHTLPSKRHKFVVGERSSSFGAGSSMVLDLSLKLPDNNSESALGERSSSSGGGSGMALDLSLKL